jgi:hypothetical protein
MRFGKKRYYALGRLKRGQKNKTEERYENEILKPLLAAGEILWYCFEGITFKLADDTRYTPDYPVLNKHGLIEIHEVKGSLKFIEDDAKVKIKVAEEKFPFLFKLIAPKAKKNGGGWEEKIIGGLQEENV